MRSPFNLATKRAASRPVPESVARWFRTRAIVIGATMVLVVIVVGLTAQSVFAQEVTTPGQKTQPPKTATTPPSDRGMIVIGAAIIMGAALLATGYAVATVGSAAMGAASERPEIMTRALLFVALAEGIAAWGLAVSIFLISKM